MHSPPVLVVAAVIERDGKVLIGQRRNGGRHALKWEFPGGKIEKGETPREALRRELAEELGIDAEIGPEIDRYEVRYGNRRPILLLFHRVPRFDGEPRNMRQGPDSVFEQIQWAEVRKLREFDFLAGDVDFVNRLARGQVR